MADLNAPSARIAARPISFPDSAQAEAGGERSADPWQQASPFPVEAKALSMVEAADGSAALALSAMPDPERGTACDLAAMPRMRRDVQARAAD